MKNKTLFNLIFSIIGTIILAYLLYLGWNYLQNKIEVVKVYRTGEVQSNSLEFGNQLRQKSQILNEQNSVIEASFIQSNQLLGFIQRLETSAQSNNLNITIEKVEEGDAEALLSSNLKVVPAKFTIQLQGEYVDTIAFIRESLAYEVQLLVESTSFYRQTGTELSGYSTRLTLSGNIISR